MSFSYKNPFFLNRKKIIFSNFLLDLEKIIIKNKKWGIDPIKNPELVGKQLKVLKEKTGLIKTRLLEQNLIFGIGNYLASEILFDSKILPFKKVNLLTDLEIEKLSESIFKICNKAKESGGFSFARGYILPDGSLGDFYKKVKVYQKDGQICPCCNKNKIIKVFLKTRSTFYCKFCQK